MEKNKTFFVSFSRHGGAGDTTHTSSTLTLRELARACERVWACVCVRHSSCILFVVVAASPAAAVLSAEVQFQGLQGRLGPSTLECPAGAGRDGTADGPDGRRSVRAWRGAARGGPRLLAGWLAGYSIPDECPRLRGSATLSATSEKERLRSETRRARAKPAGRPTGRRAASCQSFAGRDLRSAVVRPASSSVVTT